MRNVNVALLVGFLGVGLSPAAPCPGTVNDWLVSGPWPSYHGADKDSGLDADLLDPEADVVPFVGKKETATFVADKAKLIAQVGAVNEWGFVETKTFDATWRTVSAKDGVVWLNGLFAPIDDYFVTYAACYLDVPTAVQAVLAIGSDDDHKVWLDLREVGRREGSQGVTAGEFRYNVDLTPGLHRVLLKVVDRTSDCGFTLAVTDRDGKPIPDMKTLLDVRGRRLVIEDQKAAERTPEKLAAKSAALRDEIAALKAKIPGLEKRSEAAHATLDRARARLAKSYEIAEKDYADARAQAAARGSRSTDEPLPPVPHDVRSRLCVNGLWDVSGDGGKTWEKLTVPMRVVHRYFAQQYYPVARVDPSTPYGAYTNLSGFGESRGLDVLVGDRGARKFRTHFDWDGRGRVNFVAECIIGRARFSCNGVPCGSYDGRIGTVTVPMGGVRIGRNELVIDFDWSLCQMHQQSGGILGDVFFDFVGKVRVADVYVKPSWRKAELSVDTELVNEGNETRTAEVRAYAVKDGRVRFKLPPASVTLPADRTTKVSRTGGWADPVLWGIGGKYGDPELYDLVTDVLVDGRVVDRHVQSFGFREFWIRHTDFFLNGRRIILQGDVGCPRIGTARTRDVMWPLLRADGINIIRFHDSDYWSVNAPRAADRMGMLCYLQMYPECHELGYSQNDAEGSPPLDKWEATKTHAWNVANYTRWYRTFRNCPSAVIWSTDNEVFTQAWDSFDALAANVRRDRVAALYEKYVKSLDPQLVMTRDGDQGTWGGFGRWHENPPCDTANYHYPDFNVKTQARDWQKLYAWRPAVFGETLYCSYGAWDNYIGAIPDQVERKARAVRKVASQYRELGVPGQIYMGLACDGFVCRDETGRGNPYGITESEYQAWFKEGRRPRTFTELEFPWYRIEWPALSGSEMRPVASQTIGSSWTYGADVVNVYNPRFPTHVRNAVNDAYRDSLIPQPPLRVGADAEIVVTAAPGASVWAVSPSGARREGVRADNRGRAWFRFLEPGRWIFEADGARGTYQLGPRGASASKPGFQNVRFEVLAGKGDVK